MYFHHLYADGADEIERELLAINRKKFTSGLICGSALYFFFGYVLSSAHGMTGFVWLGIFGQYFSYFGLFIAGYDRALAAGVGRGLAGMILAIAFALGRIDGWDLAVIPLFVVAMLILSAQIKSVPKEELSQFIHDRKNPAPGPDF